MAYQVLARKWRPKQFEEVVGQEHVLRTLQNAIKQDKLAHAYLFTGTRGVGKTSIARLFSKAIRCENRGPNLNPCLVCPSCVDIDSGSSMDYTEIDGASNNSVDDVRSLIENVQYLPTRGKFKIYVIDEVHMLSVSAFNALLKTLEEPPAHVIFILATTDPQKLLGTVISRCQRYDFKNVPIEILYKHLQMIAKAESISFSHPKLVRKIAELGKGSIRDSLSIFDQVLALSGDNKVTEDSFTQALGLAGTSAMQELLSSILKGETKRCTRIYNQLILDNIDLKKLCDQILDGFYFVINSVDEQEKIYQEEILEVNSLSEITISEIIWIYESLVKDFGWALTSLNPEKVVLVILQKICMRRTILSASDLKLGDIPQKEVNSEQDARPQITQKAFGWNDFLAYVRRSSPTTFTNIAHGNLLNDLDTSSDILRIEIAFPDEAAVFKEYLDEREVYARLKNYLADFFERDVDKINFKTILLSKEEKADKNFKSKLEIEDEARQKEQENKKNSILNDPFVKQAEELFKSKVDKIILR